MRHTWSTDRLKLFVSAKSSREMCWIKHLPVVLLFGRASNKGKPAI